MTHGELVRANSCVHIHVWRRHHVLPKGVMPPLRFNTLDQSQGFVRYWKSNFNEIRQCEMSEGCELVDTLHESRPALIGEFELGLGDRRQHCRANGWDPVD